MRISESFICFLLPSSSRDVYGGARLLWISEGHPKFCGCRLLSAIFFFSYVARSSAGVREKDRMIYFMLRLFGREGKKNSSWRKPPGTPLLPPPSLSLRVRPVLSGAKCYTGQSVAQTMFVFSQRVPHMQEAKACEGGGRPGAVGTVTHGKVSRREGRDRQQSQRAGSPSVTGHWVSGAQPSLVSFG